MRKVTMRKYLLLPAAFLMLSGAGAAAAPAGTDPDWPCKQRLVPELTAATFWSGPALPVDRDWHADAQVASEVAAISPRDVPLDEGIVHLGHFLEKLKKAERKTILPQVFIGIVEETNRQRAEIIGSIKDLARRQRALGDTVAKITTELEDNAATSDSDAARRRDEITQRRAFVIRSFEETERTMRYACEVPVDLEARLGGYAQAIEKQL
jgi:hypothetical protein